jgi:hypothetical protein
MEGVTMTKRTDRSMLLTLSEQEAKTLREIIKPNVEPPSDMSMRKRVLCGLGVAFLCAVVVLWMVRPDLAMAIVQLASRLLALWF